MNEANKITVTYHTPKKLWAVIEFNNGLRIMTDVFDSYDKAIKEAHRLNSESTIENKYIVFESVYYTGSVKAKYYGMEFETNLDNGDME
jgi:hypothetical protein